MIPSCETCRTALEAHYQLFDHVPDCTRPSEGSPPMQWNPVRCEYKLDDSDRPRIHEVAHALINLIMLGSPGVVKMNHSGQAGECREYRNPEFELATAPEPIAIHRGCAALAGYCAELVAFGKAELGGCVYDFESLTRARQVARDAGVPFDQGNLEVVVKFLLRCHWKSVVFAAALIRPSKTCSGPELTRAMVDRDDSGLLKDFTRMPILGPGWRANWGALKAVAGRDFARQYMSQRH